MSGPSPWLRSARPVALLVVVLATTTSVGDTYPRQHCVDAIHYRFRLTLGDETDDIAGEATVELRFVEEGVKGFALDLASAKSGTGMEVSGVTSGARPCVTSTRTTGCA